MENSLSNFRYNKVGGVDADRILESGEIVPYTLTAKEIQELPEGLIITPLNNAILKQSKIQDIKNYRDKLTQHGGFKASGKWFHSDTFSRSQQLGLVLLGASIPQGLMWKTMDGTFIEMTSTLAQEVFTSAVMQDASLFYHAEVLIQQVQSLQDTPQIQDFDITQGWPETFLTL